MSTITELLIGGAVTLIVSTSTFLLGKGKTNAEKNKLEAETEHIRLENASEKLELIDKLMLKIDAMQKQINALQDTINDLKYTQCDKDVCPTYIELAKIHEKKIARKKPVIE